MIFQLQVQWWCDRYVPGRVPKPITFKTPFIFLTFLILQMRKLRHGLSLGKGHAKLGSSRTEISTQAPSKRLSGDWTFHEMEGQNQYLGTCRYKKWFPPLGRRWKGNSREMVLQRHLDHLCLNHLGAFKLRSEAQEGISPSEESHTC